MADKKISQLTAAATPLAGTEVLPIVQSGATKKVTALELTGTTVDSSGNVIISNGNFVIGASGKGIDFTAAGGDVLTMYDEGNWTPVIQGSATAGTYELQANRSKYTKVGNRVFVNCDVKLASSITGGGDGYFVIGGLPFSASLNPIAGPMPVYHYGLTFDGDNTLASSYGATTMLLGYYNAAGGQSIINISAAAADGFLRFSYSYEV